MSTWYCYLVLGYIFVLGTEVHICTWYWGTFLYSVLGFISVLGISLHINQSINQSISILSAIHLGQIETNYFDNTQVRICAKLLVFLSSLLDMLSSVIFHK